MNMEIKFFFESDVDVKLVGLFKLVVLVVFSVDDLEFVVVVFEGDELLVYEELGFSEGIIVKELEVFVFFCVGDLFRYFLVLLVFFSLND